MADSAVPIGVGMLGLGVVGSSVYRMLRQNEDRIFNQACGPIRIVKVGVRHNGKTRGAPNDLFTTDLESVVDDPAVEVVVEVIGGQEPAGSLIERAIKQGKSVVTANKALLAPRLQEFMSLAEENAACLEFEAAVGGGVPVIRALRNQLQGNRILRVGGILNGTTNYILTRMAEEKLSYDEALKTAQELGYAEADPSADVDGLDARAKLAILATLAFGCSVTPDTIHLEGIAGVQDELMSALQGQYAIKLIAEARLAEDGRLFAMVHPTAVPVREALGQVYGTENCVHLEGDFVGKLEFTGQGAGGAPTASAVVGDLIEAVCAIRQGWRPRMLPIRGGLNVAPFAETMWQYALLASTTEGTDPFALQVALNNAGLRVFYAKPLVGKSGLLVFTGRLLEKEFQRALKKVDSSVEIGGWVRMYEP